MHTPCIFVYEPLSQSEGGEEEEEEYEDSPQQPQADHS